MIKTLVLASYKGFDPSDFFSGLVLINYELCEPVAGCN